MEIFEEFEQMKAELKEKWLDYYDINRDWIKVANLHRGIGWKDFINGTESVIHCPSGALILGVISSLDKRASDFIKVLTKLSGSCGVDQTIFGLGLRFDPEAALEERRIAQEEKEEIQEAKLLTSGEDNEDEDDEIEQVKVDDLGLDELRREASKLNNSDE